MEIDAELMELDFSRLIHYLEDKRKDMEVTSESQLDRLNQL